MSKKASDKKTSAKTSSTKENGKSSGTEQEVLKTFDMYSCFSRVDVLLALAFVILAVLLGVYLWLTGDPAV